MPVFNRIDAMPDFRPHGLSICDQDLDIPIKSSPLLARESQLSIGSVNCGFF